MGSGRDHDRGDNRASERCEAVIWIDTWGLLRRVHAPPPVPRPDRGPWTLLGESGGASLLPRHLGGTEPAGDHRPFDGLVLWLPLPLHRDPPGEGSMAPVAAIPCAGRAATARWSSAAAPPPAGLSTPASMASMKKGWRPTCSISPENDFCLANAGNRPRISFAA